MLAFHGFHAYGLDISAKGVAEAQAFASKELQSPSDANFGAQYKAVEGQSRGDVKFIQGDFFTPDWEAEVGGKLDLIYDYTVYLLFLALSVEAWTKLTNINSSFAPFIPLCARIGPTGWHHFSAQTVCSLALNFPCTKTLNSLVPRGV